MPSLSALGSAAKSGGIVGAAVGAGIELISSAVDVHKGDKTVGDAAVDVAKAGAKGGVVGASSAVVSGVAAGAAGTAIGALTATGVGSAIKARIEPLSNEYKKIARELAKTSRAKNYRIILI